MFRKALSLNVVVCFFLTAVGPYPQAHADFVLNLPAPGTMVNLSPAYEPVIIKGLTVHKDNPFLFDFIVDIGQDKLSGELLKKEGEKLIKYFLAGLAIPDKDVWVNLSPYEKNRMIPETLGQTDMGRDLLEQDYILKQITASLIYPEKQLGKIFWDKVYTKAQEMYGTTQVPVNTFNKVWIMADRAQVFEHNQTAFVLDSHLKVMLEEDYLALQKHNPSVIPAKGRIDRHSQSLAGIHSVGSQIVKEIILPQLEKEVNTGKNFANLRQIFNSIILSSWYKKNLKESLLNQVYANKAKVKGIERLGVIASDAKQSQQDLSPDQIYYQYLKAYKKGVFNYIKEDSVQGQTIPHKYFSGGILGIGAAADPALTADPKMLKKALPDRALVSFKTGINIGSRKETSDAAMRSKYDSKFLRQFTLGSRLRSSGYLDEGGHINGIAYLEIIAISKYFTDDHGPCAVVYSWYSLNRQKFPEKPPEASLAAFIAYDLGFVKDPLWKQYLSDRRRVILMEKAQKQEHYQTKIDELRVFLDEHKMLNGAGQIDQMPTFEKAIQVLFDRRSNPKVVSLYLFLRKKLIRGADITDVLGQGYEYLPLGARIIHAAHLVDDSLWDEFVQEQNPDRAMHSQRSKEFSRREFLKRSVQAGAALAGATITAGIFLPEYKGEEAEIDLLPELDFDPSKKNMLFIVGAEDANPIITVDDIKSHFRDKYNIFINIYDYQNPFKYLVDDLVVKVRKLKEDYKIKNSLTVVAYSYGAVIFRAAALSEKSEGLFDGTNLKQFAPVAGGAQDVDVWARYFHTPSLFYMSQKGTWVKRDDIHISRALNPYDTTQNDLYTPQKTAEFTKKMGSIFTLLAGTDDQTMANSPIPQVRQMYKNGVGPNYEVIASATHEDLPNNHEALVALARSLDSDKATLANETRGGIDLNTANGMQWKDSKDGKGVEIDVDPAMIARIRHEGINWLSPVIFKMTPIASVWTLVGLQAPGLNDLARV